MKPLTPTPVPGSRTNLSTYSKAEVDTILAVTYAVVAGKVMNRKQKTIAILTLLLITASLFGQKLASDQVASNGVPYSGATQDVDLGPKSLKAATLKADELTVGTPTQPSRIDLTQGACPATAPAPFHWTICMESGSLYQVSAAGVKLKIGGVVKPPSIEFIQIPTPRPPFLTIAGTPVTGSVVKVFRNGQLLIPNGIGYTIAGKVITPVVIASGDWWVLEYQE